MLIANFVCSGTDSTMRLQWYTGTFRLLAIICIGANPTCAGPDNSSQVTEGSMISVQYDGYNLDYVFFQSDEGIQEGTIIPNQGGTEWTGFTTLSEAPNTSTVYSWLVPGQDPAVLIQTSDDRLEAWTYAYNGGIPESHQNITQ